MKASLYKFIKAAADKLSGKLAIQLLIIFFFCTLINAAFFNICMLFVRRAADSYELKSERMLLDGYNLSLAMQNEDISSGDTDKIDLLIDSVLEGQAYEVILTDMDGNLVYPSEEQSDRLSMIITSLDDPAEKTTLVIDMGLYAVKLNDTIIQLAIASSGNAGWIVKYNRNGIIPAIIALLSILIFVLMFLLLTKRKIRYVTEIASGIRSISKGNLNYSIGIRGNDELALLANELNCMSCELNNYFEREKNKERSKSELILSVSHDLKSPLTAVIGYLTLIKDKEYDKDETMTDYIERAYHKSLRIKSLLQELLDYEGFSDEAVKLNKQKIILNHLLEQLLSEYAGMLKENELRVIAEYSEGNIYADVDPDYIIRVYENLLTNSIRYSTKPGEIKLTLQAVDDSLIFSITNKCERIEPEELERLFDKFYRLEKSRSEETGGIGMGLAIAKRITTLHGGKIWAEYVNGEITLRVLLPAGA